MSHGGSIRRGVVGLGGLLSHLWNEAAINTWNGNQGHKWEMLVKDLQAVVDGATLGQRKGRCKITFIYKSRGSRHGFR